MHKPQTYKRLSIEQRIKLVVEINTQKSSAIKCARVLRVSRQAIYDEIKNYRTYQAPKSYHDIPPCMHSRTCDDHSHKLAHCIKVNCPRYAPMLCPLLKRFPFVCNKCPKLATCKFDKYYYDPNITHDAALDLRITARLKDYENDPHVKLVNTLLSPIIKNRNSLHHAFVTHHQSMPVCERTVRRWIYRRALDVKAHELPMWNRYKRKRTTNKRPTRTKAYNYATIAHRMYKDYRAYLKLHPALETSETDSVIGKKTDTKALLTIHLPACNFMFGYVVRKGSPVAFLRVFHNLRTFLGEHTFATLFPIILCDNGTETDKLWHLETLANGDDSRTKVFYCDPYSAWQRPTSERNHAYVRRVLLKGQSLNHLTDRFVQNMFSHINSIPRESLHNKTPYQLFKAKYGARVLQQLGIRSVPLQDVNLFEARFFQ